MNEKRQIIFTIDVDAFFAQAEEKRNPEYLNKSIGIGFLLNKKGVLTTCNYKARSRGIHSGQPIYKAIQMDPSILIIEPDYEYYVELSEKIFTIIYKYVSKMEVASIDECYVDVTKKIKPHENLISYAKKIQNDIYKQTNITVSIGISENKILSKIASNFNKPFGISTLFKSEIDTKLWPLNVMKMYGIGVNIAHKLYECKIFTIKDLAKIDKNSEQFLKLRESIGINLLRLIDQASGTTNDKIVDTYHFVKSISHAKTFPNPIYDFDILKDELFNITKIVCAKMEYRNLICRTVAIQTKDKINNKRIELDNISFLVKKYSSQQSTLRIPSNNLEIIFSEALKLLENWFDENLGVNYLGVRVNNFIEKFHFGVQQYVFDKMEESIENEEHIINDNYEEINSLIKYLNQRVGKEVFADAYSFSKIKRFHDNKMAKKDTIKFKRWN